jgi:hypothetical protein
MTDFTQLDPNETLTEGTAFVKPDPPPVHPGRVLHIDGDVCSYQCGYKWEEESPEQSIRALHLQLESLRILAGAERTRVHVSMGNKGGREDIARVKQYQEHRQEKNPGLVERVNLLREYMAALDERRHMGWAHLEQEADDGLAQAQAAAAANGTSECCVIWTVDKDLNMVGGMYLDAKTYQLGKRPWGLGKLWIEGEGQSKKVRGEGTKWFWFQVLAGDSADNIPGLPAICVKDKFQYKPTKAWNDVQARLARGGTKAKRTAARKARDKLLAKAKPQRCGDILAFDLLADCHDDKQCLDRVIDLYRGYYGPQPFEHVSWDGEAKTLRYTHMLYEQMQLLWMRRRKGAEDVMEFLKEVRA